MAEILLVEDNSAIRFAYRILLENSGHTVTEAVDGNDAIAKLETRRFDMVITDLWMPGADGFTVIAQTKRGHPDTLVLAMTGVLIGPAANDPAVRAKNAGADAVIEKPMLGEGMLTSVNALIDRAKLIRPEP
ncbi:MAG: response regulator [Rhodospirillaceae bacterium]